MRRIRNSLSAKIFLCTAAVLFTVSLAMFGLLWIFMPQTYQNELNAQRASDAQVFARQLETAPAEEWENMLVYFCVGTGVGASIFDENGIYVAGFC